MKNSILKKTLRQGRKLVLPYLPKTFVHKLIYYRHHKARWNAWHPELYDEKIHWHIVHTYGPEYGKYADKYLVREYVKDCGLEHLLIPLYGVYESADEIDFSVLPDRFILKANHGSGKPYYEICTDKHTLDENRVREKMNAALKDNYFFHSCEYHYRDIHPRILCEQLLSSENQDHIDDYKVNCHYGIPDSILVCAERDQGRDYYSCDWRYLDYTKPQYRSGKRVEAPRLLSEMLSAASILSRPFPLARVDFYIVGGKLYFGEITLTPSSGNHVNLTNKAQQVIGASIPLT